MSFSSTHSAITPTPMVSPTRTTALSFCTATLLRSEFGLGNYAPAVSDEVHVRITTEASAPKAAE